MVCVVHSPLRQKGFYLREELLIRYPQDLDHSSRALAFTRDSFTSRPLCTNQSSFYCPHPPVLPTRLQYFSTTIAQYATPLSLYATHNTLLVMAISCKGQPALVPTGVSSVACPALRYAFWPVEWL